MVKRDELVFTRVRDLDVGTTVMRVLMCGQSHVSYAIGGQAFKISTALLQSGWKRYLTLLLECGSVKLSPLSV